MGDSQYSFSLTTFSPSGKLVQIEHALTAVGSGQTSLGIKAANGVVIATEKKLPSILVDETSVQKIQCLTPNIGVVYSGMGPDFRVLVRKSRKQAEQYHKLYKEAIPVTQLVRETAAVMQEFTQSGGVRPFGVSLLVAGFDDKGPQLYQVDPSGSYFSWKASAMGKNVSNAKTFLEKRYTEDMELDDAVHTAILTLKEGFEGQISGKNIEIGIIGADKKFRLKVLYILQYAFIIQQPAASKFRCKAKKSDTATSTPTGTGTGNARRESLHLDKHGKWRSFAPRKVSRKRCGSLRGKGWKYGSGFVDGIFPVMSPTAQQILQLVQEEGVADNAIWSGLDNLLPSNDTWDDLVNICQWMLYRSTFKPDVICYNLLIEAYGQKSQYKKAESLYFELLDARCVPTEHTYALLIKAYCNVGLVDKAEAIFAEMRKYGLPSSATVYNAYIDGLVKAGNSERAVEIYQRMRRDNCQPSTETYTLMINLYGKARRSYMGLKLFNEMRSQRCKPNICTFTALINGFAREGQCEKAEEIFEQLQADGFEPDVYAYNALMEAYSRAGYAYGAAEVFSLMQHMG
ncbi:Proteasome subunit alpha type-2-A [Linum grandiflorum]